MNEDCEECVVRVSYEELEMVLAGLDVVGLFPAIKSKTTGAIIRKMVLKSGITVSGMCWKNAARYITMNKHLTGDLGPVSRFLTWRRNGGGVPSRKNLKLNKKKEEIHNDWRFPEREPEEHERMELTARVAEVGTRAVFEHFIYKFGENIYLQISRGPIGARLTMCAAQLVMQSWGSDYHASLELAKVEITLLSGYM